MDRERDRDAVTDMIEEQDQRQGGGPDRTRPGEDDPGSRPIDGQRPPEEEARPREADDVPPSADPGPFAPH